MAIRTRSLVELNQESFDYLLRNTEITLLTPGSIARALVETANRHLENFYDSLASNYHMAFLSQATGVYLDLHARMFGIQRLQPRSAAVQASDNAIRFYVTTGTLAQRLPSAGDLNQGLIPQGTLVTDDSGSVVFEVSEATTFPATASEVYVPARASAEGRGSNIGVKFLRKHNLPVNGVMVTNTVSITTGTSGETDNELRARIANHVLTREGANETAIRLSALSTPGVSDVFLDPNHYGAGSFKVTIIPIGNRVPVSTMIEVRSKVSSIAAFGMYFQIHEPKYLRFNIIITLRYEGSTEGVRTAARQSAERAVLSYFGGITPGGEMVLTALGARIRDADPAIYDYRIEQLCLNGRHQLLHNVRLERDQLFLPDQNLADPVRVI